MFEDLSASYEVLIYERSLKMPHSKSGDESSQFAGLEQVREEGFFTPGVVVLDLGIREGE